MSLDLDYGGFEEEEEESFREERHPEHRPPAHPVRPVHLHIPIQESEGVCERERDIEGARYREIEGESETLMNGYQDGVELIST